MRHFYIYIYSYYDHYVYEIVKAWYTVVVAAVVLVVAVRGENSKGKRLVHYDNIINTK